MEGTAKRHHNFPGSGGAAAAAAMKYLEEIDYKTPDYVTKWPSRR
jgi:hypothetical protein